MGNTLTAIRDFCCSTVRQCVTKWMSAGPRPEPPGDLGGAAWPVKYTYVKDLGQGAYGAVVLYRDNETGHLVAIKKLQRQVLTEPHMRNYVENEMVHVRFLVHPHIPRFIEMFTTPHHLNCVMEYAAGGTLLDYLNRHGRLSEPQARCIFQQLISAVDYIHNAGVTNRDIKLENILLQDPEPAAPWVKLIDFGFCKRIEEVARSVVGTYAYMAHEVLRNRVTRSTHEYHAPAVDVWSCGVVLYAMLARKLPFAGDNATQVLRAVEALQLQPLTPPAGLELTPECLDLLRRMLQLDPAQRITVREITRHDWYLDCRQSEDAVREHVNSAVPAAAVAQ